jgi:sec-independent protein translocase protein TatA
MMKPGIWELVIVLVIVLLLFGPGRLSKIAGELGSGIRNFREGINEGKEDEVENGDEAENEKE